jgi:hypothetical protein
MLRFFYACLSLFKGETRREFNLLRLLHNSEANLFTQP